MSIFEKAVISIVKFKLHHSLDLDDIREIPSEGLREFRDFSYHNRAGKELLMDIFEPVVDEIVHWFREHEDPMTS